MADDDQNSRALGDDPLSSDKLLEKAFYSEYRPPSRKSRGSSKAKPSHYKVISISLYNEDLERLDTMVAELKRRGHTKASKSQLIRFALDSVDLDDMPRSY